MLNQRRRETMAAVRQQGHPPTIGYPPVSVTMPVPLLSAGALFGAVEVLAARQRFAPRVEKISVWVGAVGPTVLAGCVFMGGVTLLFSVGSIDGVLMMVLAYRLQQRSRSAWASSAVLLWVGAVSLMLKGLPGKRPASSRCYSLSCWPQDGSFSSKAHHPLKSTHLAG